MGQSKFELSFFASYLDYEIYLFVNGKYVNWRLKFRQEISFIFTSKAYDYLNQVFCSPPETNKKVEETLFRKVSFSKVQICWAIIMFLRSLNVLLSTEAIGSFASSWSRPCQEVYTTKTCKIKFLYSFHFCK